ncbi:MAG: aminoacyl-tRNA hydrolase [bacterium]|nr:aminoacyl-tRNA hydrolase [bacterium]
MLLIAGLGNPGGKYKNTRHNIGFRVVDELRSSSHFATARVIDEFARKNNFPDFHFAKKYNAEISEGNLDNEKYILAKPRTFMNNSGRAVKSLMSTAKPDLMVIHDDIDLPLGKIKISIGRGSAGHKGVESIIQAINSKNFIRIRVGILPETGKPKNPEDFVLQKFQQNEEKIVKDTIKKTIEAIEIIMGKGIEKAMNQYN